MKKIKRKNIVIVIAIVLFLAAGLLVINKPSYSAQPLENTCAENIMLVAANEEIYLEGKNNKIILPYGRNFANLPERPIALEEDNIYLSPKNYRFFSMDGYRLFTHEKKYNGIVEYWMLENVVSTRTNNNSIILSYLINDTKFSDDENEDDYYQQLLVLWAMDRLAGFEDEKNYIYDYPDIVEAPVDNNYYEKYENYNQYHVNYWQYQNNLSVGDKKLIKESKYGDKMLSYLDTWEDYVAWYLDGQNVELDSITQNDISYYVTNDYVETKLITPKSTGKVYSDKFASYTVEVSSPMTVLDSNGNEKKEFKAGEGFKVRIPISEIKDKTINYSIKVKGDFDFEALTLFDANYPELERYEMPSYLRQQLYDLYKRSIVVRPCSTTKTLKDDIELNFTQKVGDLNVKVIDTSTGNNLSKATVQIEDEKGNIVYRYETTEKDFNVTLPTGNYLVKQTITPPNYEAITIQMRVSIEENGESSVVLENAPLVNVPDTNMTSYMPLIGFITLIFGILILGIIIRTKKYEQDF